MCGGLTASFVIDVPAMLTAGHAAVVGFDVPPAGRPAAVSVGSAAERAVVAAGSVGSVGSVVEHAVVAAVFVGSAVEHAVVAAGSVGSVGSVGSAVEHVVVALAGHAVVALAEHVVAALAWLPLGHAVRRQEQWFRETEAGSMSRKLQTLSYPLPQLQNSYAVYDT